MLAAAWVSLLTNQILPAWSVHEILECQGAWHRFRGRLYRVSSAPAASNRDLALMLGDIALLLDDYRSQLEDSEAPRSECPLGHVALHLAEALPTAASRSLEEAEELLGRDLHVMQALGWNALVRSGWPVFQLLYLLYRCMVQSPQHPKHDPCIDSDGYAWKLQDRLLHRPNTDEVGLMAASWAFIASEEAQRCQLLASAALLAMVWIRLPVYDAESEGLIRVAEAQSGIWDMLSAVAGHPLLLTAARVCSAYQLLIHLGRGEKLEHPEPEGSEQEAEERNLSEPGFSASCRVGPPQLVRA